MILIETPAGNPRYVGNSETGGFASAAPQQLRRGTGPHTGRSLIRDKDDAPGPLLRSSKGSEALNQGLEDRFWISRGD